MFNKSKLVFNFSAGPAKLPESVLERAQRELHEYEHCGASILEISHRSPEFDNLIHKTEHNLRDLMHIPSDYETLFLQGGGTGQFAAVPLNLMNSNGSEKPSADYIITGDWSKKAVKEAEKYLTVNKVLNPPLKQFNRIPSTTDWNLNKDASYVYYCANETIHGVEFNFIPETGSVPLVADISSNALSRPIDVSKHGLLFAGAQKNLGTAGLTVVIVRKDLIGKASPACPSIFDFKEQHSMKSVYNTPPVFCIYVTSLVLEWIRDQGGLEEMEKRNARKAELIYDVINDYSDFYHCPVARDCRSRMNIPFRIGSADGVASLEKQFVVESEKRGMISLKGHRNVGGIRASLFNAVSVEEVQTLAEFMREFHDNFSKNGV